MATIPTTLELIRRKLHEFLQTTDPRNEDRVILANMVDEEGHVYEPAKHKVVMLLANIQRETAISTYTRTVPGKDNQYAIPAPTLYIDLFVLFFANFPGGNYTQGLAEISQTIRFFQENPLFTHENLPGLDPAMDKLTFELVNLDLADLHHLMDMIGAKYLPSVYYKVRMIPFGSGATSGASPV